MTQEKNQSVASCCSLSTTGTLFASVVAGGASLLAYALYIEPQRLDLTHPEIFLRRLPPAMDGFTVLLLADPHVVHYGKREARLLEILRTIDVPDLIIWAGDLMHRHNPSDALRLAEEVTALLPTVPAYFVHGNAEHKTRAHRRRDFVARLERIGITALLNRHVDFASRGTTITLAGVDDPYYGHADLAMALDGAPADRFTLLLAHSPQIATQAARAGVDLMLSGHTHGGQVRLPGIGPLKTQNPLARSMDCGLWNRERLAAVLGFDPGGDLQTYISRGIGVAPLPRFHSIAPRLFCRPEIPVLTLRSAV